MRLRRMVSLFCSVLTLNTRLCMESLDTFQFNDWDDTRSVFLILAKTWCLLRDVGEDAVTFLSLWNCRMSLETLSAHLKRYFGMSEEIVVPIGIARCAPFGCDNDEGVAIFKIG